jgi:Domain of Unknown Function with PDB structure (DUF3857)
VRLSNRRAVVAFVRLSVCLLICLAGRDAAGQAPAANGAPVASEGSKATEYSKEAYVVEQSLTKVAFQNDGTYTAESTLRVRIQASSGVQQFGLLQFPYASGNSTMDIAFVRVLKADGRTVQTAEENVLDMPAAITQQAPFYSDLKEKQVAVKGLIE